MWLCNGAAVPGLGHDRNDFLSCQDAFKVISRRNFGCICISDGAGSAKYAREGAELTASAVIQLLSDHFFSIYNTSQDKIASKITGYVVGKIQNECARHGDGRTVRDYNATLLAVAVKGRKCLILHVGDGIIGCYSNNRLEILSHPWNGEFKNETVFITSKLAISTMDVVKTKVPYGNISYFMMSDGTAISFYSDEKRELISKKGLIQLCNLSRSLTQEDFQEMLRYNLFERISKNTLDDCSFCIMTK